MRKAAYGSGNASAGAEREARLPEPAELQLQRQPWDGPYDWDADAEAWVCQAHGTADCRQSPMCEHYGRIKEQELRNGLPGCECFPHGPDEPCSCGGCWACNGHVVGCTCDIDWDCEHRRSP